MAKQLNKQLNELEQQLISEGVNTAELTNYIFTKYRSLVVKAVNAHKDADRYCRLREFRTSVVDNTCADHWRQNASIASAAHKLIQYIESIGG